MSGNGTNAKRKNQERKHKVVSREERFTPGFKSPSMVGIHSVTGG
jgi:hypothetical protein